MRLAIVIPTIPPREASLARCVASYEAQTKDIEVDIQVYRDSPSAGEGWLAGTTEYVAAEGPPDYLHLTNDDIEVTSEEWWVAAAEVCDTGRLPAPIVYNPDGSLQSAGGQLGAAADLLHKIGPDGAEVGFTTVPFLSWEQWRVIGMLPVHYSSDVYVSERGRQLGMQTVLCHGYELIHHTEQAGRLDTAAQDKATVLDALRT